MHVWNVVHPDFPWDDDARVDHGMPAVLVRKFGLMIMQGSEWDAPMVELPLTVTITADGRLQANAENARMYTDNHVKPNDRVRLVNPDPAATPQHIDLIVGTRKGKGLPDQEVHLDVASMKLARASPNNDGGTQWKLCRNSVRPASRVDATIEHTLLHRGLEGYDVTSLTQLLRMDTGLGLSPHLRQHCPAVRDFIGGKSTDPQHLSYDRNNFIGHLTGGLLKTDQYAKLCSKYRGMIQTMVDEGLLAPGWVDGFAAHLASLDSQQLLVELDLPAKSTIDELRKRDKRVKRLTLAQAKLFKKLTGMLGQTGYPPRWAVQAPSGSGKTILCIKMALWHVERRANPDLASVVGDGPNPADRYLLLTHSKTLVTECVRELVDSSMREIEIELCQQVRDDLPKSLRKSAEAGVWVELKARKGSGAVTVATIDAVIDAGLLVRAAERRVRQELESVFKVLSEDVKRSAIDAFVQRRAVGKVGCSESQQMLLEFQDGLVSGMHRTVAGLDHLPPSTVQALTSKLDLVVGTTDLTDLRYGGMVVDEGHLVFSYQPHQWLDGQHTLKDKGDTAKVVEFVLAGPDTPVVVFHDTMYQPLASIEPEFPKGCKTYTAPLQVVRNPPSVRDGALPFGTELQPLYRGVGNSRVSFFTLLDEKDGGKRRNTEPGRPIRYVNVAKTRLRYKLEGGLAVYVRSPGFKSTVGFETFGREDGDSDVEESKEDLTCKKEHMRQTAKYGHAIAAELWSIIQELAVGLVETGEHENWGDQIAVISPGLPSENASLMLLARTLKSARRLTGDTDGLVVALLLGATQRPEAGRLFFGAAENIAGLERDYVLVTGFNQPGYLRERHRLGKLYERVDPAAYVALTRCTFQLVCVEVDAERFGAHLRISGVADSGLVRPVGQAAAAGVAAGRVDWSAPGDGPESNQGTVHLQHQIRADLSQRGYATIPDAVWQHNGLNDLDLSTNMLVAVPSDVAALTSLKRLWLDRNQLRALPAEIGRLKKLEKLDLLSNKLTTLPGEIGGLQKLKKLDLRWNKFTTLPDDIGGLQKLEQLRLGGNMLTTLPAEIGQLASLLRLDLQSNKLTSIPGEIGGLQMLVALHLRDNQLTTLPAEICGLQKLVTLPAEICGLQKLVMLTLQGNQLTTLPANIGQLASLQGLHLGHNHLTSIPDDIGGLKKLESLGLDANKLTALPANIGQLVSLLRLKLQGNKLTSIPSDIGGLQKLVKLNLAGNQLTTLPAEIGQLACLQRLELQGNKLTSIPDEIGGLQKLVILNLGGNGLSSIPDAIYGLGMLQFLDLHNNRLSMLPANVGPLVRLQQRLEQQGVRHNLFNDTLTVLPTWIGRPNLHGHQCKVGALEENVDLQTDEFAPSVWLGVMCDQIACQLSFDGMQLWPSSKAPNNPRRKFGLAPRGIYNWRGGLICYHSGYSGDRSAFRWWEWESGKQLDLRRTKLVRLPNEIWQLIAITELILWDTQLEEVPSDIGNLVNLKLLHLGDNELKALPAEIGELAQLEALSVWKNRLQALPATVGNLSNLKTLLAWGNRWLSTLPDALGQLTQLRRLGLSHNSIAVLPEWLATSFPKLEALDLRHNPRLSAERLPAWFNRWAATATSNGVKIRLTAGIPGDLIATASRRHSGANDGERDAEGRKAKFGTLPRFRIAMRGAWATASTDELKRKMRATLSAVGAVDVADAEPVAQRSGGMRHGPHLRMARRSATFDSDSKDDDGDDESTSRDAKVWAGSAEAQAVVTANVMPNSWRSKRKQKRELKKMLLNGGGGGHDAVFGSSAEGTPKRLFEVAVELVYRGPRSVHFIVGVTSIGEDSPHGLPYDDTARTKASSPQGWDALLPAVQEWVSLFKKKCLATDDASSALNVAAPNM